MSNITDTNEDWKTLIFYIDKNLITKAKFWISNIFKLVFKYIDSFVFRENIEK